MAREDKKLIRLLSIQEREQMKREAAVIRDITAAYERARRFLLNDLTRAYGRLTDPEDPEQIRTLAGRAAILQAIRQRLAELEAELGNILGESLADVVEATAEGVGEELALIAKIAGAGYTPTAFGIDRALEATVVPAIEQIEGVVGALRAGLISQLRTGLAAGERFTELASRLYWSTTSGDRVSLFRNGKVSATLMARRAVAQANNNSRQLFLEDGKSQLPTLKKRISARIDSRTTRLSLQMHGKIQELDQPFDVTSGPPRPFARKMMGPPFTWNDRDTMTGYLEAFEGTSLNTKQMRDRANEALKNMEE